MDPMNRLRLALCVQSLAPTGRRLGVPLALALVAGLTVASPARQSTPATPAAEGEMKAPAAALPVPKAPPAPSPTPEATPEALRLMVADSLERLALFTLRTVASPTGKDFAASAMLLGLAQERAPDDLNLLRRRAEAAWGAGDQDLLLELTQRTVQVDPSNTVAQLRLIATRLAKYQTVEERLSRMDALLGPRGASLDASIRSRLALDAALLHRERGEEEKFVEKLKLATGLDSTNKDAALLALTFFSSRSDDPMGRLELMTNLLYADPLDPNAHITLARHLTQMGAFDQARRFHRVQAMILAADGVRANFRTTIEALMLDWRCEGAKSPSDFIRQRLYSERNAAARNAREARSEAVEGAAGNVVNMPGPQDVRLDMLFEEVRLATASVLGDATELAQSAADMAATVAERTQILSLPNAREREWTDETAAAESRLLRQQLNFWRLMTASDVDKVEADLPACTKDLPERNAKVMAIKAWMALRKGDAAGALELASQETDEPADPHLLMAKGEALAALNRTDEAVAALRAAAAADPLTTHCTFAMDRANRLAGSPKRRGDADTALAKQASTYARKIPGWIDSMVSQPQMFQLVSMDQPPSRVGALERAVLTLRIRNASPIPLALGSNKPINARFLFSPMIEVAAITDPPATVPEVFEFDRRFRLMPREELTLAVRPDAGLTGYLAQLGAAGPTRVRYRVLQGFKVTDKGAGCIELNTPTTAREPLLEARLSAEQLNERIDAATDATIGAVTTGAMAMLLDGSTPATTGFGQDFKPEMARRLVARYPSLSVEGRMFMACVLPPSSQVAVLEALDAAIKADPHPSLRVVGLLTRVAKSDDPALAAGAADADASVAKAAAIQSERLASGAPTYASVGTADLIKPRIATTTTGVR